MKRTISLIAVFLSVFPLYALAADNKPAELDLDGPEPAFKATYSYHKSNQMLSLDSSGGMELDADVTSIDTAILRWDPERKKFYGTGWMDLKSHVDLNIYEEGKQTGKVKGKLPEKARFYIEASAPKTDPKGIFGQGVMARVRVYSDDPRWSVSGQYQGKTLADTMEDPLDTHFTDVPIGVEKALAPLKAGNYIEKHSILIEAVDLSDPTLRDHPRQEPGEVPSPTAFQQMQQRDRAAAGEIQQEVALMEQELNAQGPPRTAEEAQAQREDREIMALISRAATKMRTEDYSQES